MLKCMKILVSVLVGSLSIRVTRNVLRRNRRLRRLLYLPR
jgi:multisubunit Na+/H+ antiporter MnhE subunit